MDRAGWIRYQRNRNAYRPGTILHARRFSYDPAVNIVDAMKKLEWVEHAMGFYPRNEEGRRVSGRLSRVRATGKLLRRFGDVEHDWIRHEPLPFHARIVVKNEDKERIPPPKSFRANELRREVLRAQALADYARMDFRPPPEIWSVLRQQMREANTLLDLSVSSLFRVFNDGSIRKGGRYYGPAYQGIPSKLRCWYYLNDMPTVELDFKCLHPSILYAEAFEPIPDDCYALPGYEGKDFRPLIKRALNVFINAGTRKKAEDSLVYRWTMERKHNSGIRKDKRVWTSAWGVRNAKKARAVVKSLLDDLAKQHRPIARHFGTGEGKRLQAEDAAIAGRVLAETFSAHCPIMIFHDGFRVIHDQAEHVWRIMRSEFRTRFHQDIRVEAKNPTPPLSPPIFSDTDNALVSRLLAIGG